MKTVGIIGNIGSGKSYVSKLFRQHGFTAIDLDFDAKFLYELDVIKINMKILFGDDIYVDGKINKTELASIIFNNDSKRVQLEKLLKPYLLKQLYEDLYHLEYVQKEKIVFIESATMLKTGLYKSFDEIIVVYSDYKDRLRMVTEHRGMSANDFYNRNNMQIQISESLRILKKNNIKYTFFHNKYDNSSELFVLDYIKSNI
jgi:dephospho-CoA kinase